jgi:hypothetical protein
MKKQTIIFTSASSGIGKEIPRHLDAIYINMKRFYSSLFCQVYCWY